MDSPTNMEQMQATSEKDAASAADGITRTTDGSDETIKDYTTESTKEADQADMNASLSTPQESTIHSHDQRLHGSCNSSPDNHESSTVQHPQARDILPHQPSSELQHEHMFSSNSGSDEFGSGDPDLDQLCRISANRFGAPESPYDDLPLSFSLPYSASGDGKGARMYSCNICSFKTIFKNSLVNHQAVHSDARPWICEICDYAAKRKQDLKKHLQTMHGMVVDSLALKPGQGMVVDSLALKPGANPPASSASSSGLASPVETKPLIVNNVVVSDDQRGSGMLGFGPHMAHSASVLAHQQAAAAATQFGHPLPSSATMNQNARSMPMPAVGKFISDKFPFNQYFGDGGMPRFPGEAFMSPTQLGLRASAKDDKGASGLDSLPSHRFHSQGVGGQSAIHKFHSKDTGLHSEGRDSGHYLPSVSEILSKDRLRPGSSSDQRTAARSPEMGSRVPEIATGHARDARPVDPNSPARVSSVSEGIGLGTSHRWKRSSGDLSSEDGFQADQSMVSRKATRLESSGSECDPLQHVSSQSDHAGSVEPISSTDSHARSLETRKSFHCLHCDIMFFDNALYLMHMGLHDNSNPWKCSVCGRTFFEKYSFTSHFINQH